MNTSLLIELKSDYTILLKQILSPIILEGLQSLYEESEKISDKNNILRNFQALLKKIISWDITTINTEISRIQMKTSQFPWLIQLVQATFKINMLIHDLQATEIQKREINYGTFIHQVYIECYRIFWKDPFLFYHEYSSLEKKKNNLLIVEYIEKAIDNAIRRLLPIGMILEKFLGNSTVNGKELELQDLYNIPMLLDVTLEKNNIAQEVAKEVVNLVKPNLQTSQLSQNGAGNNDNSNNIVLNDTLEKDVNNQILNIINKNKILSESHEDNHFTVNNHTNHQALSDKRTSSTLKRIINESLRNSHNSQKNGSHRSHNSHHSQRAGSNSENSHIKNKILKELDSESITYNADENENYQDIFSNSEKINNTINTNEKQEKKSREKFFNNYLNI